MSYKMALYYWLVCDTCGRSSTEGGEHSAWADEFSAEDEARNEGWLVSKFGHHCVDCIQWCPYCESEEIPKSLDHCSSCAENVGSAETSPCGEPR